MRIRSTLEVSRELGVPGWRLNDLVRRRDVQPAVVAGRRLWFPEDQSTVGRHLAERGVLVPRSALVAQS